jgi:hypothetical protein
MTCAGPSPSSSFTFSSSPASCRIMNVAPDFSLVGSPRFGARCAALTAGLVACRLLQLRDVFDLVPPATIQELIAKYPNASDLKALFVALDSLQKGMLLSLSFALEDLR